MQNQPIQLSNDVTVTLLLKGKSLSVDPLLLPWQRFFNQSSQNFELCLEMIISTSVQNFIRIQCFILPWQHIL